MAHELEQSLKAIQDHNGRLNAFVRVDADAARTSLNSQSKKTPLHGMAVSIKDLIDIAGLPTTAASNVRKGHVAERDAEVVTRLEAAGAVIIGKTNLHEFALGTTSDESAFGPVRNPHDVTRSAGGSSGGSAAAVAAGMGRASIGTDTGGSIRIPAACCGVVGLKPAAGEVPTDGVVPLSKTLDHVGPLTRTVADAALVWAVLAGRDASPPRAPERITLGVLGGYFTAVLDAWVRTAFAGAVEKLNTATINHVGATIQGTDRIANTYVDIQLPEAALYHASMLETSAALYQPGVRERLERGFTIPATRYLAALEYREVLRRSVDAALEQCDALVLPTVAIVAPPLGATEVETDDGQTMPVRAAMLRLTQLFNLTGHPAISLPIETAGGLPVGLQLVGKTNGTRELLAIAAVCERLIS